MNKKRLQSSSRAATKLRERYGRTETNTTTSEALDTASQPIDNATLPVNESTAIAGPAGTTPVAGVAEWDSAPYRIISSASGSIIGYAEKRDNARTAKTHAKSNGVPAYIEQRQSDGSYARVR